MIFFLRRADICDVQSSTFWICFLIIWVIHFLEELIFTFGKSLFCYSINCVIDIFIGGSRVNEVLVNGYFKT